MLGKNEKLLSLIVGFCSLNIEMASTDYSVVKPYRLRFGFDRFLFAPKRLLLSGDRIAEDFEFLLRS